MPKKKRLIKQRPITHAPYHAWYGAPYWGFGGPWFVGNTYPYNAVPEKNDEGDNSIDIEAPSDNYSDYSGGDFGGFDCGGCDCGGE